MHGGIDCVEILCYSPHGIEISQSVLDSGFQLLESILCSGTWIVVSSGQWDSGFLELCSRSQRPGFQIPLAKISWILLHGVKYTSGTAQGVACRGLNPTPLRAPTFSNGKFFFFYFGYPDLSLITQTKFSNLTILNTHKQRTDKLCLLVVTNEFVALNDNQKGNFGHIQRIRLKNIQVTLSRFVCWVQLQSLFI